MRLPLSTGRLRTMLIWCLAVRLNGPKSLRLYSRAFQTSRPSAITTTHVIGVPTRSSVRRFWGHAERRPCLLSAPHFFNKNRLFASRVETPASSILEGLNPSQLDAVTQPLSSVTRVVAGPGAGKTRVLTCRIAHLLYNDPDNRVLAVTFTKKAAGEMQERLEKLVKQQPQIPQAIAVDNGEIIQEEADPYDGGRLLDRVTLGTFHSVCAKILRWNGKALAQLPSVQHAMSSNVNSTFLDGTFAIIDQNEQMRVLRDCLKEAEVDLKKDGIKPLTILNALGQIKSKEIMGEDPKESTGQKPSSKAMKIATKIYPEYRQKLLSNNCLDFDDLIFHSRELLLTDESVRAQLQRRWHHVLVDEFQDTSRAQLDLVKLLSSSSLFVVGDADQSIYSWRGAYVESMSDFCDEFRNHLGDVQTVYLMENYRSTSNIVSAAQKIISDSSMNATTQDDLRRNMKPMRGGGPTPLILACANTKSEASKVTLRVLDMVASGEYGPDNTVAIIYRTNFQSRALEEACVKHNLPYVVRGAAGAFYNRHEVKDCLCFLRWLYNGRDQASMMRSVKTPSRGIGEMALNEFMLYCSHVDASWDLHYPGKAKPTPLDILISLSDENNVRGIPPATGIMSNRALNRFIPFSAQMRVIREQAYSLNVADLLSSIIDTLNLRSHFDSISKSNIEFEDRWANVMELRQASQRYSKGGPSLKQKPVGAVGVDGMELADSPLCNFLDDVALVTDTADNSERTRESERRLTANLMTIHASKGMEFDAVFLVGNEDGTFPTRQAIADGEGSVALEEEKRLCYVAMTRAKTHLVLSWRREVTVFAGSSFQSMDGERSRFLDVLVSSNDKKKRQKKHSDKGSSPTKTQKPLKEGSPKQARPVPRSSMPPRYGGEKSWEPPIRKRAVEKRRTSRNGKSHFAEEELVNGKRQIKGLAWKRLPAKSQSVRSPGTRSQRSSPTASANRVLMDSTWFYPIGSTVLHKMHGKGLVLPPPPPGDGNILLVRVKFPNGDKLDFPADGSDLQPDFGA